MFQKSLGTTAPSHPVPYLTVSTLDFIFTFPAFSLTSPIFGLNGGNPLFPESMLWCSFPLSLLMLVSASQLIFNPNFKVELKWHLFTGPSLFSKPSSTLLVSLWSGLYAVCMFINILALFLWLDLKCLQAWKHGLFTFAVFPSIKQKLTCSSQTIMEWIMYFSVIKRDSRELELTYHFLNSWAHTPNRGSYVILCYLLILNNCSNTVNAS